MIEKKSSSVLQIMELINQQEKLFAQADVEIHAAAERVRATALLPQNTLKDV
jgi:hypothetical protein